MKYRDISYYNEQNYTVLTTILLLTVLLINVKIIVFNIRGSLCKVAF